MVGRRTQGGILLGGWEEREKEVSSGQYFKNSPQGKIKHAFYRKKKKNMNTTVPRKTFFCGLEGSKEERVSCVITLGKRTSTFWF